MARSQMHVSTPPVGVVPRCHLRESIT